MRKSCEKACDHGRKVAELERTIVFGAKVLPRIVEGLQRQYTISDYGYFFEGYNNERRMYKWQQ